MVLLFILIGIFVILTIYFYIRNERVCDFKISIVDAISDHLIDYVNSEYFCEEDYKEIKTYSYYLIQKYSYADMLFSFKPLKLRYWYTEDEFEKLSVMLKLDKQNEIQ